MLLDGHQHVCPQKTGVLRNFLRFPGVGAELVDVHVVDLGDRFGQITLPVRRYFEAGINEENRKENDTSCVGFRQLGLPTSKASSRLLVLETHNLVLRKNTRTDSSTPD